MFALRRSALAWMVPAGVVTLRSVDTERTLCVPSALCSDTEYAPQSALPSLVGQCTCGRGTERPQIPVLTRGPWSSQVLGKSSAKTADGTVRCSGGRDGPQCSPVSSAQLCSAAFAVSDLLKAASSSQRAVPVWKCTEEKCEVLLSDPDLSGPWKN